MRSKDMRRREILCMVAYEKSGKRKRVKSYR